MKRLLGFMLIVVLGISLVACSGAPVATESSSAASEPSADTAASVAASTEPSVEKSEAATSGGEIALVPPGMTSPYYDALVKGAKPVAEELGYTLTVLSPEKESDAAGQVKIVEDLITKGVKAIGLCSINDDSIVTAVKKANEAGIPVIFFNSSLKELSEGDIYCYIGFQEEPGAKNICKYVSELKDGKANVAIIEGLPSTYTTARKGGFSEQAAEYPGFVIVDSQTGEWEREKAMNVATNMLQAHPEIDTFFACSDEMGLGAAQACQAANRTDIVIVSVDGNPNALEAIMNGEMTATLGVNPKLTGEVTIQQMDNAIKGIPAENKMIIIDTVVIDKTNAPDFMK
jgi:ribose transport system substrate-binding protein